MAGTHLCLDAQATKLLSNRAAVEVCVREVAALAGMTILGIMSYDLANAHGQEPGVSVVVLLAESHIAIHTWPEEGVVTADIYSCRPFDTERVKECLRGYFGITAFGDVHLLERFGIEPKKSAALVTS